MSSRKRGRGKEDVEVRLRLPRKFVPNFVALMEAVVLDGKRVKELKIAVGP